MRTIIILCLTVFASQAALADRSADVAAFNEAWRAYQEATETDDTSKIIDTAQQVAVLGKSVLGEDDERYPILLTNYGVALVSASRREQARDVLKEALKLAEKHYGRDAIELVDILEPLGDSVAEIGAPHRQLKFYKRSLGIIETHYGRNSSEFGEASLRAATQSYDLSQSTAGIAHLRDAREVLGVVYGKDSNVVGIAEYLLAKFEFSKGHYQTATGIAVEALPKLEGDDRYLIDMRMHAHALLVQTYEERGMTDEATPHCIAIGRDSRLRPQQEYQPLFRVGPRYPAALLSSGIEGHVDLEFTIDTNGFVANPKVIDVVQSNRVRPLGRMTHDTSRPENSFEAAALEAVKGFRYAPMFRDGVAVPIDNVKTRISFRIDD